MSALLATGCAALQGGDPLQVTVAGITPAQGEGMELRMLVQLRVQNPNDAPIDYSGVALQMNLQGKKFATGVSDTSGTIPRFGEALIAVPVTVSAFQMIQQALTMTQGQASGKISYEMKGKLQSSGLGTKHFSTQGTLDLPSAAPDAEAR